MRSVSVVVVRKTARGRLEKLRGRPRAPRVWSEKRLIKVRRCMIIPATFLQHARPHEGDRMSPKKHSQSRDAAAARQSPPRREAASAEPSFTQVRQDAVVRRAAVAPDSLRPRDVLQ